MTLVLWSNAHHCLAPALDDPQTFEKCLSLLSLFPARGISQNNQQVTSCIISFRRKRRRIWQQVGLIDRYMLHCMLIYMMYNCNFPVASAVVSCFPQLLLMNLCNTFVVLLKWSRLRPGPMTPGVLPKLSWCRSSKRIFTIILQGRLNPWQGFGLSAVRQEIFHVEL